jgi:hypothetical protein
MHRYVAIVLLICSWAPGAWAKTIKIPKGSINVNQLHDELLERFSTWRGTQQADGSFRDPVLRVEHTDQEIILTVPDNADEAAIQSMVASHVPRPRATGPAQDPLKVLEQRVSRLEALVGLE